VEDDVALRSAVARALRLTGRELEEAPTCEAALKALPRGFDLVLLDVRLPDGSGVTVAEKAAAMTPAPLIVVSSGEASAQEAFTLGQLGVVQFVSKPFSLDELMAAIDLVHTARVELAPIVRAYVGKADLRMVQDDVRRAMVQQALALSNGNRSAAAKLLRVTRQAIQKFLRHDGPQPKLR
jgi:DNA-binding NtrC family response regulator